MVEKEYANALFELAQASNSLELVKNEYSLLIEAINNNPDFLNVLTYPSIKADKKKETISTVLKGANELFINFLFVLIDNGRIDHIISIYDSFNALLDANNNVVNVTVKSAHSLNNEQLASLDEKLHKIFSSSSFNIEVVIDEALLGGILVSANGKEIDISLANKLTKLKNNI